MVLNEVLGFLTNNLLLVGLLAFFFFFGDEIYKKIVKFTRHKTKSTAMDFVITLLLVLILALVPIMTSQLMIRFLPAAINAIILLVLLALCFQKYRS